MIKDIKNYENVYQIDELGNVISKPKKWIRGYRKEYFLKPKLNKYGYLCVILQNNKIKKNYTIHRLVAEHFIPNPENKPQVNHINGIKTDNMVENLEWCTASENIKHAHKNKLIVQLRGKNPNARKVINNKTKEIFNCINDARENTKYSYSYFYNMLNGTYENKTDFEFYNQPIY